MGRRRWNVPARGNRRGDSRCRAIVVPTASTRAAARDGPRPDGGAGPRSSKRPPIKRQTAKRERRELELERKREPRQRSKVIRIAYTLVMAPVWALAAGMTTFYIVAGGLALLVLWSSLAYAVIVVVG